MIMIIMSLIYSRSNALFQNLFLNRVTDTLSCSSSLKTNIIMFIPIKSGNTKRSGLLRLIYTYKTVC
jgi:hypothetical protein